MLVTPENNRRNRSRALVFTSLLGVMCGMGSWFYLPLIVLLGLCPVVYWLLRRRCLRRMRILGQPFPSAWEHVLQSHVAFFRALPAAEKQRFRQLIQVFLDEVLITGVRTDVDDTVRVLVAASAVIPIFGFHDWEYHRLGEVLIYPGPFGERYQPPADTDGNILGLVGLKHLSGVMILSKPSLLDGFDNPTSKENVGVHEFVHLMEQEESEHGLPPEVPWQAVKHWIRYVARELSRPPKNRSFIEKYAYSNEHEFLAVLAEYFFKSPDLLQRKAPELYAMLREMFHQDTGSLLRLTSTGRQRYGRNSPCPCGSGKKFKHCCLLKAAEAGTRESAADNPPVSG
jgi:MtfA peptidase